jgi:hypothetical protein
MPRLLILSVLLAVCTACALGPHIPTTDQMLAIARWNCRDLGEPTETQCIQAAMQVQLEAIQPALAAEATPPSPQVIYQQVPVYQPRPRVVIQGSRSNMPLQPGLLPGTYYQPGPGGPRWLSVQPLP